MVLLEGLNTEQQQAVLATEGYVRVIAGAGTGKTKTLSNRFAYIVEELGVNASNILCVTFTNKAAGEMRSRIKHLVGEENDVAYVSTYHGFCAKVLRRDITYLSWPKGFIILDEEDRKSIVREIHEELNIKTEQKRIIDSLIMINDAKNESGYVKSLIGDTEKITYNNDDDLDTIIFKKYLVKQKKNYGLDFNDLINFVFHLFSLNKEVLGKWQAKLNYVLVDEFQDSSSKQVGLVEMLAEKHENLFVVGDPDQSIYGWRGGDPNFLVNFDKLHKKCQTIILNKNYRSTQKILNVSNDLIKKNTNRIDKKLIATHSGDILPLFFYGDNEYQEITWILNHIKELKKDGVEYHDIAIIYRANYLSRFLEQGLLRENIPYNIYGGFKFFERKEIKDLLSYIRLIIFGDDISFMRIVNEPKRGVGKKKKNFIKTQAEKENISYLNSLEKYINHIVLNTSNLLGFLQFIQDMKKIQDKESVSNFIQKVYVESGYEKHLVTNGEIDRIENVQELLDAVVNEEEINSEFTITDFLTNTSLATDYNSEPQSAVKLMTGHVAKGLEFPHVFLTSLTEDIFPNHRALQDGKLESLEEERRLAYVALTRAEKQLYISSSSGYSRKGEKLPSRFIFEIKKSNLKIEKDISKEIKDKAKKSYKKYENNSVGNNEVFKVRDKVIHPVFGEGIIKIVDKKASKYLIEFKKEDIERHINMNYKKLKLIN